MVSENLRQYITKTLFLALQFIMIAIVIRFFVLSPGRVEGFSMEPTLQDNEFFLLNKVEYLFRPPKRFDIVQIILPDEANAFGIKRVIGLPGEKVVIDPKNITIIQKDGVQIILEEPYLSGASFNQMSAHRSEEISVPENHYYVMGDNRSNSRDSRYFGPIHRRLINGKAISFWGFSFL